MYLDAYTLSALVDELMDTVVGGKVQDTVSVDATGLGMEIYADHRRRYLYISGDSNNPRLHLVEDKLRRGLTTPTQLGLLLRRYVEGGTILHISQPKWERVMQIDIDGPEGEVALIIEPMERRSNILLVQNGIIVDCMRRVGPEENRYRLSLPAHQYVAPPPQKDKLDPHHMDQDQFKQLFKSVTDPKRKPQQVIASGVLGVSPLLAREALFRAGQEVNRKADAIDTDAVYEALRALIEPLEDRRWEIGIVENDGVIEAFSVYPIEHLPNWQPIESISTGIAGYYGAPTGEEAYTAAKQPVFGAITEAEGKLGAKLASLQRSMVDDSDREVLRQSGDLILAYQYTLQPGQTELKAQYDLDQPELTIKLDPTVTPLENAQRYFNRYTKAKKALDDVPQLIRETQNELAYLGQLRVDLELASNWPEIDEVQQALQSKGHWKGKNVKRIGGGGQSAPIRYVTKDGFVIWVGRNSRQNEMVSFKKASGEDLWLHAREVPGAHVVIKHDGRVIPDTVIDQAAALAAYYSARRRDGKVPVDVTRIKYVRKIKGAAPGMVTYRNETTRITTPRDEKSLT
ncbi:MAG: NFACT family protein [Anaerolineae bacterium]|jgi:predicted ribosome quality control (RQC) complex YloA/Tae2 family protein|nr:NFACT family protein [Anaerolineae bacterium]